MRYITFSTLAVGSVLLQSLAVFGHGDESHEAIHKRTEFIKQRSLSSCHDNVKARALFERSFHRRSALINSIRKKRGLEERSLEHSHRIAKRDLQSVSQIDHNSTFAEAASDIDSSVLFSGNTSCILTPEVTEGPYFVSGEYVREDITDGEPGVDLYLDVQVIDVNTCEPVSSAYFDAWHTNATGVYSGVVARGNGNAADQTNIDATFCRGVQESDSDGVVKFKTIFPGYYSGRTTHIHVMAHKGGQKYENGTYDGKGHVTHIGQMFFDEDLRTAVQQLDPYRTNTQSKVLNANDQIASQEAGNNYDPFVLYAYLGDSLSDGLLGWITVGIDTNEAYDPSVATSLTEDGGVVVGHKGVVGTGEEVDVSDSPNSSTSLSLSSGSSPTGISNSTSGTSTNVAAATDTAIIPSSGSRVVPLSFFAIMVAAGNAIHGLF